MANPEKFAYSELALVFAAIKYLGPLVIGSSSGLTFDAIFVEFAAVACAVVARPTVIWILCPAVNREILAIMLYVALSVIVIGPTS